MSPAEKKAARPEGSRRAKPVAPEASSRYTPKAPTFRRRPRWHRFAGWLGIGLGVLIAVLNDTMFMVEEVLLPGGHSEAYLILAFVVAGGSTWFLGLFDRGTTIFD